LEKILIVNEKLTLRSVEERDLEALRRLLNDPEIESTTMGTHFPLSREMQEQWFRNTFPVENAIRVVIETPEGEMAGTYLCGLIDWENMTGYIGGKLFREHRGKKFGYLAAYYLSEYLFAQRGFKRLIGVHISTNQANIPIYKRMGLRYEGLQKGRCQKNGKRVDIMHFSYGPDDLIRLEG
jgi:RimJ/RimL family protein N-acetyltransferase